MKHLRQKHLVKRILSLLVITCLLSTTFLPQIGFCDGFSASQIILSQTDSGQGPITQDTAPEEIIKDPAADINNQNAENLITSINQIISSINSADIPDASINTILIIIPDVSLNIDRTSNAEQQEELIEKFAEALDSVLNAYSKHTSLELASTISKIINKLGSSGISAEKIRAKTQELYEELINSVDKLIENSADNTSLLTTVKDIISNTSPLVQNNMPADTSGVKNGNSFPSKSSVSSSIEQSASYGIKPLNDINSIVKKTVERLGELNLQSTSEGTNAFIDINNNVIRKYKKPQ